MNVPLILRRIKPKKVAYKRRASSPAMEGIIGYMEVGIYQGTYEHKEVVDIIDGPSYCTKGRSDVHRVVYRQIFNVYSVDLGGH